MADILHALPLFPLGVVLYPGERLPLHIFEPRYKEMVGFCLDHEVPFGIVLYNDETMAQVGCTARVVEVVHTYEDGRMDILTEGQTRFRVRALYDDKSYLTGDAEVIEGVAEPPEDALRERLITQHMKLLEMAGRTVRPSRYQGESHISFLIAHNVGLTLEQKQAVLEIESENERIAYLVAHLERFIPRVKEVEDTRRRVRSNGHFKDFPSESS